MLILTLPCLAALPVEVRLGWPSEGCERGDMCLLYAPGAHFHAASTRLSLRHLPGGAFSSASLHLGTYDHSDEALEGVRSACSLQHIAAA